MITIYHNAILRNVNLRCENKKLRKEIDILETEISRLQKQHDKELANLETKLEKKYATMNKRNDILSEDNRRLIAIDRKKDKEIELLKKKR